MGPKEAFGARKETPRGADHRQAPRHREAHRAGHVPMAAKRVRVTDLTDHVGSSSQTPQPRISSRRVRTPAFPFSRTGEILQRVSAAPAVERTKFSQPPVSRSLEWQNHSRTREKSHAVLAQWQSSGFVTSRATCAT